MIPNLQIIEVQYWKSSLSGYERTTNRFFFSKQRAYQVLKNQGFKALDEFTFARGSLRATLAERLIEE